MKNPNVSLTPASGAFNLPNPRRAGERNDLPAFGTKECVPLDEWTSKLT